MRLFKGSRTKMQTGQSLVILAIGFLALLGFVGIVTDVSVLFIRYSTMRRALDAAAIAAAGQMRRVDDATPNDGIAQGEATSVANLNLAARQFIELYGLNPTSVVVETCRAQQVGRDNSGNPFDADPYTNPPTNTVVNPNAHPLYIQVPDPNDATKTITQVNPAADPAVVKRYQELCTPDELKLVRVTAQIDAPTIFLRLLGYPTVTLTESAISQTAVLDVVMIFDVSESMLNETSYSDWDQIPNPDPLQPAGSVIKEGVRYVPPYVDFSANPAIWRYLADNNETTLDAITGINSDTTPAILPSPTPPDQVGNQRVIRFEQCTPGGGDPACTASPSDPTTGWKEWLPTSVDSYTHAAISDQGREQPRELCRARAFLPTAQLLTSAVTPDMQTAYSEFLGDGTFGYSTTAGHTDGTYTYAAKLDHFQDVHYSGFVTQYNYFGCCNDPLGTTFTAADGVTQNFSFDDLVCQPFKDARDAASQFLDRLDFLRGDRVAFVTFNRVAHVVDPDGVTYKADGTLATPAGGPQASMIETQYNLLTNPANPASPILRKGAVETLKDVVGVMADTASYADTNNDGLWDAVVDGDSRTQATHTYDQLLTTPIGDFATNPVNNACPYDKAVLDVPFMPSNELTKPDGTPRVNDLLDDVITVPTWFTGAYARLHSYEYRASCAGTNTGGALAAGSGTLFNEGRREGAVWVMVMLSDGAAGASNPITRINNQNIAPVRPYVITNNAYDPQPGVGGPFCTDPASPVFPCSHNSTGGYGFFGLCPYGTSGQPSQLLTHSAFPFCDDLDPASRHYCGTFAVMPDAALDADQTSPKAAGCINYYGVDDYAHDWADWIGVADLPNAASGGTTGRVGDQLLPTIFTIGFGINYDQGTPATCAATDYNCIRGVASSPAANDNTSLRRDRQTDYVGEELLRYIADVGDNFQIDNDYWQLNASQAPLTCVSGGANNRLGNCIDLTSSSPNWGGRGACEAPWNAATDGLRGTKYMPVPPRESCGNYFWAPNGQELQNVFNQIASHMFTRLSQ